MNKIIIDGITSVEIVPIQATFISPEKSSELGVKIIADNLIDQAALYWCLFFPITTPDGLTFGKSAEGNLTISGINYETWNGNNDYPYTFTADALNLTIV